MRRCPLPPKPHPLEPCLLLRDSVPARATAGSPVPDEWAWRVMGARDTVGAGLRGWMSRDRASGSRGRGGAGQGAGLSWSWPWDRASACVGPAGEGARRGRARRAGRSQPGGGAARGLTAALAAAAAAVLGLASVATSGPAAAPARDPGRGWRREARGGGAWRWWASLERPPSSVSGAGRPEAEGGV